MLKMNIRPDVIVTDLDDDVETLLRLNGEGVIAVIHAHGDNIERIRHVVPKLAGPVLGTTQAEEDGIIHNFGGFTDGDRAVFLAMECGAEKIILKGFDFDAPVAKVGADPETKKKKLAYSKELIEHASNHFGVEVIVE